MPFDTDVEDVLAIQKDITPQELRLLLVESAQEVFDKMVSMPIQPVDKEEIDFSGEGKHYSAVIGFSGGWKGFVTLQCTQSLAAQITGKLLYMDAAQVGPDDMRDAIGEMVNMVGGRFKSGFAEHFNEGAEAFKMSIPTVTFGQDFKVFAAGDNAQIMVVLDADRSLLSLDLTLKQGGSKFSHSATSLLT